MRVWGSGGYTSASTGREEYKTPEMREKKIIRSAFCQATISTFVPLHPGIPGWPSGPSCPCSPWEINASRNVLNVTLNFIIIMYHYIFFMLLPYVLGSNRYGAYSLLCCMFNVFCVWWASVPAVPEVLGNLVLPANPDGLRSSEQHQQAIFW